MSVQDRLPMVAVTDDTPSVESEIELPTRVLAPNEFLFRTGDAKTCLYRVNSGAVCLYEQNRTDHRSPSTLPSRVTSWGWGSWEPMPAVHARSRRPR